MLGLSCRHGGGEGDIILPANVQFHMGSKAPEPNVISMHPHGQKALWLHRLPPVPGLGPQETWEGGPQRIHHVGEVNMGDPTTRPVLAYSPSALAWRASRSVMTAKSAALSSLM